MRIFWVEAENPYTIALAGEMVRLGHDINHITSHFIQHPKDALQAFPAYSTAKIIDSENLYRRETLRAQYEDIFETLDIDTLSFFEAIERDAYIISDRWNYNPISYRERKLYFRDLIRFWLGYVKKEGIEGVYFPCTPHTTWELVLLQTCKYLDIPAYYLAHTAINNRSLLRDGYGALPIVPENYLSGKNAAEILASLDPELRRDFEEDSIVTNVIKAENDSFNKQENLNASVAILDDKKPKENLTLQQQTRHLAATAYHAAQSLWQRKFFLPMAMDNHSNMLLWQLARFRHRIAAAKLKRFYSDHARPIDLTKPYVYFPLHLQPELTTQPEAGVFEDHLLVLETIIKALPNGWRVYVKENPRQYDVTINEVSAENFRTIRDMKDLLATSKNVSLVPQSIKSAELIEKAKAVVVLTGTAGWEALTSGKPCISLAYPWYSPCQSCIKVQTPEEMARAFAKVQTITEEDVGRDLAAYLHYYSDKLFIGTLSDPINVGFNTRSEAELLRHHAVALDERLKEKAAIPYRPAAQNS